MKIKLEGDSVLLCCGKGRCPALKKSHTKPNHYELCDDFGGKVILTQDHLLALKEALNKLNDS